METSKVYNTLNWLLLCRRARAEGYPVAYTTDPAWLVDMAINRRAGWPDDPGLLRGSAMPVNGCYPKRASDQEWRDLQTLARKVNTPRLIVREEECPARFRGRLAHRFFSEN